MEVASDGDEPATAEPPAPAQTSPADGKQPKLRGRAASPNGRAAKAKTKRAPKRQQREPRSSVSHRKSFPAGAFEESLTIAEAIQKHGAGVNKIRRLTLFEKLGKSPDSSASRGMIYSSSRYGLTKGGHTSEYIELTADGNTATSPDVSPTDRIRARFRLAIASIPPFETLYEMLLDKRLPALEVMRDHLTDADYTKEEAAECVDTFIVNAKFVGVLRTIAGAERVLSLDHALEDMGTGEASERLHGPQPPMGTVQGGASEWDKICFYITAIGDPESEQRQHSDLFLSSIVEPAVEEFGLTVVRADRIGKGGMISAQVIEHVVRSKLVIADLSFLNPNVFYELCLRHACRLPTVQIIRESDEIPFDLEQVRTVRIDNASIYTLIPRLRTYQSEVATQVRRALSDADGSENPLTVFFPALWEVLARPKAGASL